MSIARVLSADEAAALIADGAVVAISSSSGLNTPDRVLRAIGERFAREGRPRGLTTCTRSAPATCTASRASTTSRGRACSRA